MKTVLDKPFIVKIKTELLIRITDKQTLDADISLFDDLASVMSDASICGLGHTAASAVRSALNLGLLETNNE